MEFSFSPSVVSQDSEGGGVSRGKQTDKLSLQQGKEKGEKTEYKLEEGKLSSTTPLESQVHERLSLLLALEEEEEEGMLVDREGGEDVIGSENYFEGKVLILFLPPFHSRNKKTEEGEGGKRNMLLQLAFLGSLKEGEDTGREGKNHHCILMFVTIKILYTK